jgi:MGT family glycosyltransferase
MSAMARQLWCAPWIAHEVREALAREPVDVLVTDCMLLGALCAGEAEGIPTVSLFHGAFALFRQGPLFDLLMAGLPALNGLRKELGLAPVARISQLHDACALSLVATPREFEPDLPRPANIRFVGPLLDPLPLRRQQEAVHVDPNGPPPILVSFSTGQQGQTAVLQRVVEGLAGLDAQVVVTTGSAIDPARLSAPPRIQVVRFAPHATLLPRARLVVTHAGLGTVMAALTHGVPMLSMPMGRDQFFNAARVAALGAGRTLPLDAPAGAIAAATEAMLADEGARQAAGGFAEIIRCYGNGTLGIAALEALAKGPAAGARVRVAG